MKKLMWILFVLVCSLVAGSVYADSYVHSSEVVFLDADTKEQCEEMWGMYWLSYDDLSSQYNQEKSCTASPSSLLTEDQKTKIELVAEKIIELIAGDVSQYDLVLDQLESLDQKFTQSWDVNNLAMVKFLKVPIEYEQRSINLHQAKSNKDSSIDRWLYSISKDQYDVDAHAKDGGVVYWLPFFSDMYGEYVSDSWDILTIDNDNILRLTLVVKNPDWTPLDFWYYNNGADWPFRVAAIWGELYSVDINWDDLIFPIHYNNENWVVTFDVNWFYSDQKYFVDHSTVSFLLFCRHCSDWEDPMSINFGEREKYRMIDIKTYSVMTSQE